MTKSKLPHGTLTKLANEFKLSISTIKNMIDGKYLHERQTEIFSRAKELKADHQKKLLELENLKKELA